MTPTDYRALGDLVDVRGFGVLTAPGYRPVETVGLTELIERMGIAPKEISAITQQTVNRAAVRGRTRVARAVRDEVRIKYGEALDKVTATKAFFATGVTQARIFAEKRGLMLSRYDYRKLVLTNREGDSKQQGVTVHVGRDKGRKALPFAFVVKLRNGAIALASRPKGERRKFEVLHGPSASQIFDTKRPEIAGELQVWTRNEISRRVRYLTGGKGQTLVPRGAIEAE